MPNTWQLQKKTKQGGGQMTNARIRDARIRDEQLAGQLDEIIRELQAARKEFEALEAMLAKREAQNEPIH